MERQYIDLGEQAFTLINSPLIFLILAGNIFYAFCLIFPPRSRQRLKLTLRILLGFLVWCSINYSVSLALIYWLLKENKSFKMLAVSHMVVLFFVHNSMTCSVWLNFYYYIQIVPSQRALLIWVKKNIRFVICMALLLDGMLFLCSHAVILAETITSRGITDINSTWTEHHFDELYFTSQVCFFVVQVHMMICLCVMMVSSFSTAHYLCRHIRSMAQGGSSFSTPRTQSQMRVTITGISQGVLYLLYATFYLLDSITYNLSPHFLFSAWVSFTVTSLYTSGTTVNLCIGQAIFRQRAANVWKALKVWCWHGNKLCGNALHSADIR